ncbi:spore maturation protein [Fodinisporobacter ferrooxydans]|uniref:Spore maturation protein n=1 Tax=Fodinisporobacter ferrooxydans TaxID=2901836 RepID=A0ABY4CKA6_9BACL|nr:spore maturation protein [Alicyclobacillaceae bacterium MYW30-H2]
MISFIQSISDWALPFVIVAIPIIAYMRKVPIYDTFVEGAKEGFGTAVHLIPHLVAMMVAVTVFRESGAFDLLIRGIQPILNIFHVPADVLPLGILRSISGSGSITILTDIYQRFGPDSLIGKMASTMMGASDTTLYVLTVYFGSVGIRNARYALKVGLLSDFASVVASIVVANLLFAPH